MVKHIETETKELLRLWIKVHQNQDSVGYFEEENIQFWSDIVFEWQYLSSTVAINLRELGETSKDVNTFSIWWVNY